MRINRYIIKVANRIRNPLFILFIALAFCIWYLNKLNSIYIGTISLPIEISGVSNPQSIVGEGNTYILQAKIKGHGYSILLNKLFPYINKVEMSVYDISIIQTSDSLYEFIDIPSLERAVSGKIRNMELITLLTKELKVEKNVYIEKTLPVKPNIVLSLKRRYMQTEDVKLDPCSVLVKGYSNTINSLNYIQTKTINIDKDSELSGHIYLTEIEGVSLSTNNIFYHVDIEEYSEINFQAKVRVVVSGEDKKSDKFIVMPQDVMVKCYVTKSGSVASKNIKNSFYIDCSSNNEKESNGNYIGDNKYRVNYDSIHEGIRIVEISPSHVTALKKVSDYD